MVSKASIALSFRSMCGSLREPPAASKQRIPAATPHIGQGTASNIFAVSSRIRIGTGYSVARTKTVRFGIVFLGTSSTPYIKRMLFTTAMVR